MKGLYIHIPFCEYICHYCDFVKQVPKNKQVMIDYIEKLIEEISSYQQHFNTIETIYIGGGTPSMLEEAIIEPLLMALKAIHPIEFTIEVNPDSYTSKKGELYFKYGINRISLGVQTFNQTLLESLNRRHNKKQVFDVVADLKRIGFPFISIDLIYALPNQTLMDLQYDLNMIEKLDITHVSCYTLILEMKTYFYYLYLKGLLKLQDEDLEASMYEYLNAALRQQGFIQYEISNYAKNNHVSKHNIIYWKQDDYIGCGMGAHGYINGYRTYNQKAYYPYLKSPHLESVLETKEDQLANHLIFGLRMIEGVSLDEIMMRFQVDVFKYFPELNEKLELGLIQIENGFLKLTEKGLLLGNEVFRVFV